MRICMLTSEFPPDLGGISYHVYNLSNKLVERGHNVTVITRGKWRKSDYEKIDGISIYRVRFIPSYPDIFKLHGFFVNKLFRSMESSFDLVHMHGMLIPVIHTSLPTVLTPHGTIRGDIINTPVKSFWFLMVKLLGKQLVNTERYLLNHADVITAVSQSYVDGIRKHYRLDKEITVINPGMDTEYFTPGRNADKDNTYILYTGRLETRKGLVDLVESAKYVCQRYPGIKFVLSGKGTIEGYLKRLVNNLGLEGNFHFVGYVDRDALLEYYQNAAIYVLPSYYEGLPATLLEAMSCGIPPVATAVEGTSEVIIDGETGLLVPPRNAEKLAEAMLKLLDDEEARKQIGLKAREHVKNNYRWQIIVNRIEKVYQSAAAGAR